MSHPVSPRTRAARRTSAALFAIATMAGAARAQNGPVSGACAVTSPSVRDVVAADACQKAADLFLLLAPQLGTAVAGGNVEPGQGGALGGLGHFGVSVRVNGLRAPIPRFDDATLSVLGARRSQLSTTGTWLGFPEADVAIGLFRGLPIGLTSVGGIDLLVNGAYVPSFTRDQLAVRTTGGALRLGVGARLGLLEESMFVPGVALALVRRQTPTATVDARSGNDTVGVRDFDVRTDSWRLTVAKGVIFARVAAGVGRDRVDARATLAAVVNEAGLRVPSGDRTFRQRFTRTNYFANLTLGRLPFAALVGEIGRTSGGSLPETYNSFDGRRPDAAYTYGSLSVRVGR